MAASLPRLGATAFQRRRNSGPLRQRSERPPPRAPLSLPLPLPPPPALAERPLALAHPNQAQVTPPRSKSPPNQSRTRALVDNFKSPVTALDEPQSKRICREAHAPAANDLLTASQECFKCMKDVKWKIKTKLPPDDELQKQSLEFIKNLSQCQECWNIQGNRTSCTCVQILRGNQDLICYLARVKCVVQKMRVKDKDMYEHYAKLLMKEHACEVKRGLHPLPRLPKEEDGTGLSMSSILPDLANRRICRGLWRRIIGCNRPQYIEFEKSALFKGISQEINTNHDIDDFLHQINPDYDKLVVDADLLRSEVHGDDASHVATFRH